MDRAPTEIYTLSLHDALPISDAVAAVGDQPVGYRAGPVPGPHPPDVDAVRVGGPAEARVGAQLPLGLDRKSTRLNSSHANISHAVFCLKKKRVLATHSFLSSR